MYKKVLDSDCDRELTAKVTGMLIDLDILELEEIVDILSSEKSFNDRLAEAIEVIKEES